MKQKITSLRRIKLDEILDHDWLRENGLYADIGSNGGPGDQSSPKCNSLYDKSDQSSGGSTCN